MAHCKITHVRMSAGGYAHEHIVAVANLQGNWSMTREQVIRDIDSKLNTFFVVDPHTAQTAYVGVIRPLGRDAYIRTYADGDYNDNLLSLPRF